jgi:hypothetical protein
MRQVHYFTTESEATKEAIFPEKRQSHPAENGPHVASQIREALGENRAHIVSSQQQLRY